MRPIGEGAKLRDQGEGARTSRISMMQASVYVSTIGPITTLKIKKEPVPLIANFLIN